MSSLPLPVKIRREAIRGGRIFNKLFGRDDTVYVDERIAEYRAYWAGAAARLTANFEDLSNDTWEVTLDDRSTRLRNYMTEADDPVTLELAGDKPYCIRLAQELGLPVAAVGLIDIADWHRVRRVREEG